MPVTRQTRKENIMERESKCDIIVFISHEVTSLFFLLSMTMFASTGTSEHNYYVLSNNIIGHYIITIIQSLFTVCMM